MPCDLLLLGGFCSKLHEVAFDLISGDGKTLWVFRTFEKGRESAHVDEQTLSQHKKVDKNTHRELGEAFSQIDWRWNYGEKDCLKLTPGKPIPNKIMDLVKDASASQTQLQKEALAIIKAWPLGKDDKRLANLKAGHGDCAQNIGKLNHMVEFGELPGGMASTKENLDSLMQEMASHTASFNELVQTTKGIVAARKN